MTDPSPPPPEQRPPTLWQTILSVAASFFGVQSSRNRQRDFKQGKVIHFIFIGLVMTALFILTVWTAVKLALRSAGL